MTRTPQEAREWAAGLLAALGTPDSVGHIANLVGIQRAGIDLARTVVTLAARVAVYEAALDDAPDTVREWAADVRADADAAAMLVRR